MFEWTYIYIYISCNLFIAVSTCKSVIDFLFDLFLFFVLCLFICSCFLYPGE